MTRPTRSKLDGPKPCGASASWDAAARASPGFSQEEGARSGEYQNSTPTVRMMRSRTNIAGQALPMARLIPSRSF
jgi:hypothetical protein